MNECLDQFDPKKIVNLRFITDKKDIDFFVNVVLNERRILDSFLHFSSAMVFSKHEGNID